MMSKQQNKESAMFCHIISFFDMSTCFVQEIEGMVTRKMISLFILVSKLSATLSIQKHESQSNKVHCIVI